MLSCLVPNHHPYTTSGLGAGQTCEMGPQTLENISFKERATTPDGTARRDGAGGSVGGQYPRSSHPTCPPLFWHKKTTLTSIPLLGSPLILFSSHHEEERRQEAFPEHLLLQQEVQCRPSSTGIEMT